MAVAQRAAATDVIQRGLDSSGRPLRMTAVEWQCYDEENARLGGKLVIVQGGFQAGSGASASAGTHDQAGCKDVRRWNLTTDEAQRHIAHGRSLGDIVWERTVAQGFDPHFHDLLPVARPMHSLAAQQVQMFHRGLNGLASGAADTGPRPDPFPTYRYEEDDVTLTDTQDERLAQAAARSAHIEAMLKRFIPAEQQRDAAERERDAAFRAADLKRMAGLADTLGVVINRLPDEAKASAEERETRRLVREVKRDLLHALRDDPATDDTPDDPSDDGLRQADDAAVRAAKG